jgi:hypothetical protein
MAYLLVRLAAVVTLFGIVKVSRTAVPDERLFGSWKDTLLVAPTTLAASAQKTH